MVELVERESHGWAVVVSEEDAGRAPSELVLQ